LLGARGRRSWEAQKTDSGVVDAVELGVELESNQVGD
jgi:hypothetical protein